MFRHREEKWGASKCDGRAWPIEDFLTIYMKKINFFYREKVYKIINVKIYVILFYFINILLL